MRYTAKWWRGLDRRGLRWSALDPRSGSALPVGAQKPTSTGTHSAELARPDCDPTVPPGLRHEDSRVSRDTREGYWESRAHGRSRAEERANN